ncbi:MAG: hypothetical protein A2534_04650 [Candidatus Magasanikbacteria bacterium RIFOXYD2_FULL_39_9]|uniref:Uncharacterized protein n=1 Tax=Candidatus Magasanikbacteria bacterium RIFOXYD1_FULL_40_23 TaxID=1798705 RepID=A0A1F6PAX3_9BACT|nr:MAG: hypothetical protein A2534_04650 [Candidatus Magasanikbacteria bacterium RIFOXYD2_FULL_39_9]OGH93312.1 MAG: hypothetical protein A2563_01755 [Candidatus Magasanikbacteria bacterium RIFOXYD1_FULL_40_23]
MLNSSSVSTTIKELIATQPLEFTIAQGYFSDILNAQLVIFSLLVAGLVSLYFIFNYKISKSQVQKIEESLQKKFNESVNKLKGDLRAELKLEIELYKKELQPVITKHENEILIVKGQAYRALAELWGSQKDYRASFAWWIRAADSFNSADSEALTRVCLSLAREVVEKIEYGFEISTDIVGEYQNVMKKIKNTNYKIEKELLEKALKATLDKKLETK